MICETGSVPGVNIAAITIMITIECFLYLRMKSGVKMPSFVRKNDTIGSSKINPAANITLIIMDMYSSIAN